jgi:predicted nucleotidyltransferase
MPHSSLNITRKVDPNTLALLQSVAHAARHLGIPFFVIGATARDLILHHYYGAAITRATRDLDFGIQVADWSTFEALRAHLLESGFSKTKTLHRLNSTMGCWVDLVPFGVLSNDNQAIAWPPNGDVVMSILGFSEAFKHALHVTINDSPTIKIPVVSPVGLALLKVVSWSEREREKRPNDAKDLLYICTNYRMIPAIYDEMYTQDAMMERYGWVPESGSANLLGRDVRTMVTSNTHEYLKRLFNQKIEHRPLKELIRESCDTASQYEKNEATILAFIDGYRNQ